MTSIEQTAERVFDACETGKGWEGCQQYLPRARDVLCPSRRTGASTRCYTIVEFDVIPRADLG